MRSSLILALTIASGCAPQAISTANTQTQTPGQSVAVTEMPAGHPEVPSIADPVSNAHVGRAARRLNVDQLRASLLTITGYTWTASRTLPDEEGISGTMVVPNADMLEVTAATLGRADYVNTTSNSIDPAVTFSKLANDAARSTCRAAVADDMRQADATRRRLLREVAPTATVATERESVRRNLAYMALRFWGRQVDVASTEIDALERLFTLAASAPAQTAMGTRPARPAGTPEAGWRTVCIAMATDAQFLTY